MFQPSNLNSSQLCNRHTIEQRWGIGTTHGCKQPLSKISESSTCPGRGSGSGRRKPLPSFAVAAPSSAVCAIPNAFLPQTLSRDCRVITAHLPQNCHTDSARLNQLPQLCRTSQRRSPNLVDLAIARSHELSYQGRIGLHALPGGLGFYRKLRVELLNCGSDLKNPITSFTSEL